MLTVYIVINQIAHNIVLLTAQIAVYRLFDVNGTGTEWDIILC